MRVFLKTILLIFVTGFVQAQTDSLLNELSGSTGKERIEILHLLIINNWLNYPDEAINYANEAIILSDSISDLPLASKSARLKGGTHYYLGNYDSSLFYNKKALDMSVLTGDTALINNAHNNIGLVYYAMGSYQNALENLLRALSLKKAMGEVYGRAQTINNIGLVYNKLKDYGHAREYFNDALDFSTKHNDLNLQLYSLNNIAGTYLAQEKLSKAKEYFERALSLKVDNKNWNAVTLSGLAQICQKREDWSASRDYFRQALDLRNEIGEKNGISEIYYFYAKEAQIKENYDSALSMLKISQDLAEAIGSKDRMFENFELYVDVYTQKGDLQKAFDYQTKLLGLRDTLFNENMARNLADIQLKIQDEETRALLSKKDEQISESKKITIFLIIIIGLAIVILIIILVALRHNTRVNKLLGHQNLEISEQKEEIMLQKENLLEKNIALEKAHVLIEEQNKKLEQYNVQLQKTVDERTNELELRNYELKMANLELDNFIYKSSHDIKGPLATLMGVCNVALIDVKEPKAREYLTMLSQTANGLNDILSRLKTVSDINSLNLKVEKIDFNHIINNCVEQVKNLEGIDDVKLKYKIEDHLEYKGDPVLMDLIIFNMIQNAVKFQEGNKNDLVEIDIAYEDDRLVMHFIDNGIGINQKDADSIFEMFSKSAEKHQSIGLGLYLVKQCVQKLGGEIMLINDKKNQTHFRVVLPSF